MKLQYFDGEETVVLIEGTNGINEIIPPNYVSDHGNEENNTNNYIVKYDDGRRQTITSPYTMLTEIE